MPSTDWLARGGTYFVLAFIWLGCAAFYYVLGVKLGHQTGSPNDGCLYGFCGVLLALFGGGIGFLTMIHSYPYFILSSTVGAVALPSGGALYFASRARRGR